MAGCSLAPGCLPIMPYIQIVRVFFNKQTSRRATGLPASALPPELQWDRQEPCRYPSLRPNRFSNFMHVPCSIFNTIEVRNCNAGSIPADAAQRRSYVLLAASSSSCPVGVLRRVTPPPSSRLELRCPQGGQPLQLHCMSVRAAAARNERDMLTNSMNICRTVPPPLPPAVVGSGSNLNCKIINTDHCRQKQQSMVSEPVRHPQPPQTAQQAGRCRRQATQRWFEERLQA